MNNFENLNQRNSSDKIWKAALYIRLSRDDGDKLESESITSQREMLCHFLSQNPDLKYVDE